MLKLIGLVATAIVALILFTGHGPDAWKLITQSSDEASQQYEKISDQVDSAAQTGKKIKDQADAANKAAAAING